MTDIIHQDIHNHADTIEANADYLLRELQRIAISEQLKPDALSHLMTTAANIVVEADAIKDSVELHQDTQNA